MLFSGTHISHSAHLSLDCGMQLNVCMPCICTRSQHRCSVWPVELILLRSLHASGFVDNWRLRDLALLFSGALGISDAAEHVSATTKDPGRNYLVLSTPRMFVKGPKHVPAIQAKRRPRVRPYALFLLA